DRRDPAVPIFRVGQMDQAVGIHVEGDAGRTFRAVGPGDRVGDHGMTIPPLGPMPWPVKYRPPSPASNVAIAAISSGWPKRASGIASSLCRHSVLMFAEPSISV